MSAAEETIKPTPQVRRQSAPFLNRALDFLSSVRFGIVQLVILVILSMIGMLVLQQNVQGFDAYYASLTPAEKLVFGKLGFFDIYHSWYFNVLLLSLSLNIVLASIDRWPSAWKYIRDPKRTATREWLLARGDHATLSTGLTDVETVDVVSESMRAQGFKPIATPFETTEYGTDEQGRKDFSKLRKRTATVIFGEAGSYNRLGAYIVHVFLLTLFIGHFVALQTGFDADVRMIPGAATDEIQMIDYDLDKKSKFNVKLPFSMECTDIQQRLIDQNGSIDVSNTLDWRTQLRIKDPDYGEMVADVSMNKPLSYRGYRFFQAQTIPVGNARTISLELTPEGGGQVVRTDLSRNGATTLPDGTAVEYAEFMPDFTFGRDGQPDTRSGEYNNPVAILNVTPPGGERTRVFAFAQKLADNMPVGAPKAGYKWRLASYEKSPLAHVLSIKYDPYDAAFIAWYIGGFGLCLALIYVFFFSHRRVWAYVETLPDGRTEVVMAADANRNKIAFTDKFNLLAARVKRAIDPQSE
jgi:cytochrome c biogenesis protein